MDTESRELSPDWRTVSAAHLETQVGLQGLGKAGQIERRAAEHDVRHLTPAVLRAMEVKRVAYLSGDLADAVLGHPASIGVHLRRVHRAGSACGSGSGPSEDISEKLIAPPSAS